MIFIFIFIIIIYKGSNLAKIVKFIDGIYKNLKKISKESDADLSKIKEDYPNWGITKDLKTTFQEIHDSWRSKENN